MLDILVYFCNTSRMIMFIIVDAIFENNLVYQYRFSINYKLSNIVQMKKIAQFFKAGFNRYKVNFEQQLC